MGSVILAIIIAWLVSPIVLIILLVQEKHRHSEDVGYWMNKVDALKKENENLRNGRSANSAVSGGNGGSIFASDLDDLHRTPSQRSRTSPPSYGRPQYGMELGTQQAAVNTPPVPAPAPVQRPAPEKVTQTAVHTAENVQAETAAAVESRPAENTGRTAAQTVSEMPAQPAAASVELTKKAAETDVTTAEESKVSVPQASDDAVSEAIKAADTFEASLEKATAQVEKFEKQAHSAVASLAEKTDSIQKTAAYTVPAASEPP
ncbi:MAG: hypothetical protein II782_08390, partial [Oscillospiraceae bacterium]|nr:hypothetical protein [Oscillospiraceae bacterium]